MYKIKIDTDIPDSTYFTISDVSPLIYDGGTEAGRLIVFSGKGSRRSWGTPGVDSTVVVNYGDFAAVHVGFHHKHRGGQGWFYFAAGERRTWAQLTEAQQKRVLKNIKKAPGYAHIPGVLKSQRKVAAKTIQIAYKLVKVDADGDFISIYDNETHYSLGKKFTQAAKPDHSGGFYAYPTIEAARAFKSSEFAKNVKRFALLEVEISGKIIAYDNNKLAATHIKPLRVIDEMINV